jgi:PAS domain S-box-containing protein
MPASMAREKPVPADAPADGAPEAFRKSEELFRALVEHSLDAVSLFGSDGVAFYVSPSVERVLGYKPEEIVGQSFTELLHPEDRDRAREVFGRCLANPGIPFTTEVRCRHGDGTWHHLEGTGVNRLDDPSIRAVVGNYRDITARRRAEESLHASERRFRALIESSSDAIALFGPDGTILYGSPATARILGYTSEEFVGRNAFDLIRDEDRGYVRERLAESLRHPGEQVAVHARVLRRDGSWRFLEGVFTNLLDDPSVGGIVNNYRDVTETRRAEGALRRSEERYRTIFDLAPVGIYQSREDGSLITCNAALAAMLGYESAEELLGRNLKEVYADPAEREVLIAKYEAVETARSVEIRWKKRDGTPIWVEIDAHSLRDEKSGRYFEAFVHDVTARRESERNRQQLEEQLIQSQKMEAVGRLAGGIAHDFNNLLTAIAGYSELLLGQLPPGDPRLGHAAEIRKAGERAAALTRQLLAFSRRQVLEPRVLDLNAVVSGMRDMLRRMIGEDIELRTQPALGLWPVKADPGQIEQAVLNLVVNARDAMPQGGKLTIETANVEIDEKFARGYVSVESGQYAMLAVTDSGVGMGEATKARLFEPFFTTKERGKGTGLGLSTTYGIVKQSGGYIWCYSEPGRGTTFKIYLPRADAPVEKPAPAPAAPLSLAAAGETILLVEDEREVRALVQKLLKMQGYTLLTAADPEEAISMAREYKGKIDLMVTDVVMPRMSGREVAERLAVSRPDMKILFVSGYTDDAIVRHGILEPGTAFLQKPFSPQALARKVREVLEAGRTETA